MTRLCVKLGSLHADLTPPSGHTTYKSFKEVPKKRLQNSVVGTAKLAWSISWINKLSKQIMFKKTPKEFKSRYIVVLGCGASILGVQNQVHFLLHFKKYRKNPSNLKAKIIIILYTQNWKSTTEVMIVVLAEKSCQNAGTFTRNLKI